jgi:uncharacterized membrane protein
MLSSLPPWTIVLLISMLPFIELRGSIPTGILVFHMDPATVLLMSLIGNLIPVPFILILFERTEKWLRKYEFWSKLMDRIFERTRKKASKKVEEYEALALIFFVAIPLPGTGAWTGSLIAYLFGMDIKKSFLYISIGVIIAGIAITLLCIGL